MTTTMDLYNQAVAQGVSRRQTMPSIPDARKAVAAILAGQVPDLPDPAVDWIRQRTEEEVEDIYQMSLSVLDYVVYELSCLIEFPSRLEGWHERTRMVFRQREELEGVAELLHFTSRGVDLWEMLEGADGLCSSIIGLLPPVNGMENEDGLSRAVISTPEAWWLSRVP